MYSYGTLHMAEQKRGDHLGPTYSGSVRIRSVALRTCRKRWTVGRGGERGSGVYVLMVLQDDDDDMYMYIINFSFESFSFQRELMVLNRSLRDNKSPGLFSIFWPISTLL